MCLWLRGEEEAHERLNPCIGTQMVGSLVSHRDGAPGPVHVLSGPHSPGLPSHYMRVSCTQRDPGSNMPSHLIYLPILP